MFDDQIYEGVTGLLAEGLAITFLSAVAADLRCVDAGKPSAEPHAVFGDHVAGVAIMTMHDLSGEFFVGLRLSVRVFGLFGGMRPD